MMDDLFFDNLENNKETAKKGIFEELAWQKEVAKINHQPKNRRNEIIRVLKRDTHLKTKEKEFKYFYLSWGIGLIVTIIAIVGGYQYLSFKAISEEPALSHKLEPLDMDEVSLSPKMWQ